MPTEVENYLFDLRGFLILRGALDRGLVGRLNGAMDALPPLQPGQWHGHVECQEHHPKRGINYQNVLEAGAPFEELIDHPAWIEHVRHYIGVGTDGLYIDETFFSLRGPGEAINIHSGGHSRTIRTQFRYHDGQFHCGQVNILMALTDIGPGDGATMVIPSSHKSNVRHPAFREDYQKLKEQSAEGTVGAMEVHLQAGDALLFVDALCHGSAERRNSGQRRICVYRYGPGWGNARFGYQPSVALLERLTPERRKIVQPIPPRRPTEQPIARVSHVPAY
jgi:hypothetical protein